MIEEEEFSEDDPTEESDLEKSSILELKLGK